MQETELFIKNQQHFQRLAQWVNCTPKQFEGIYGATLNNMRQLWHPQCEKYQLAYEALLHDMLNFAKDALKLRQGFFLPGNPLTLEAMVAEAPQWTYGVFLMACLMKAKQFIDKKHELEPLDKIVPHGVMLWIKPNQRLITSIEAVYQPRNQAQHNPLWQLLDRVDAIRQKQLNETHNKEDVNKTHSKEEVLLIRLLDYLKQHGKPDKTMLLSLEGLLISDAMLQLFLKHESITSTELVKSLWHFLMIENGNFTWRYHARDYDEALPHMDGILILKRYLMEDWLSQPLSNAFVLIK